MIGVVGLDYRSRPPHRDGTERARRDARARRIGGVLTLALLAWVHGAPAAAQDARRTATIFVGGFINSGADSHGVFGVEGREAILDSVAALVGLPVARGGEATLPPNVAATVRYYGDTPPPYYTTADIDTLARLTARWGGGVPRYAQIVAVYARELMRKSGAQQVNLVSGSFGSLIVRWLIEKDLGQLASSGRIARWLSLEGVLAGNWAASQGQLVDLLGAIQPLSIDVDHMAYDWVQANVHAPRDEFDSPLYARMLLGSLASTNDDYKNGLLSDLMLAAHAWQPNDGLQAVADALFLRVSSRSQYVGLPPVRGLLRSNHFDAKSNRGGWADVATFLTQSRRVAIVMTDATLKDVSEATQPVDLRPAEVVLESRVTSPAVEARWGIGDPLCVREKEGGVAPLRRFQESGEHQRFTEFLFDGMVLPEETTLRLDLHAEEVDYDWRYNVFETVNPPFYDELGSGSLMVSTVNPGTYTFDAPGWSCAVAVLTYDYPFTSGALAAVPPSYRPPLALSIAPDPHSGPVRISLLGLAAPPGSERATLHVIDIAGRRVRSLAGDPGAGIVWDGRDERGVPVAAGVYLYRLETSRGSWTGRSVKVH